jgi:hypothetical protein
MASFSNYKSTIVTASNTAAGVSAGVTVYAARSSLPSSGNSQGDQAYVTGNNRLYIWNGSGWYNVALLNVAPSIQSVLDSDGASTPFQLSIEGATTTITITAVDSDGDPVTYAATSDSDFAGLATLSQADNVFTITPFSQDSATTESGTITFTATDGVNVASSGVQTFTLSFLSALWDETVLSLSEPKATNRLDNLPLLIVHQIAHISHRYCKSILHYQSAFHPYLDNWSVDLDGSGDYLSVGTTIFNHLATGTSTGAFATFEAWVNPRSYATSTQAWQFSSVFSKGTVYANFGVRNGKLRFYWYDGAPKFVESTSATDVPLNTWTHIAVTIDESTINLYVNGVLNTTSQTFTGIAAAGSNSAFTIGLEFGGNQYFNGFISNLRVSDQILYTSTFTPPSENLTAVSGTLILTCQSNRFIDNSTNDHAITVNGNSEVSVFNPFGQGSEYAAGENKGSVYLNGPNQFVAIPDNDDFELTGDFTIELWMYYISGTATYPSIIGGNGSSSNGWNLYVVATNKIAFWHGSFLIAGNNDDFIPKTWNHIALTRSGSDIKLFVNGEQTGTATSSATFNQGTANAGSRIGYDYGANGYITGYFADVKIQNGTAAYTSAFTPPSSPLTNSGSDTVLYLPFDNAGIFDKAGNSAILLSGDTVTSTTYTKYATTSVFTDTGGMLINNVESPLSNDFTYEGWFYPTEVPGSGNAFISHGWGGYGAFVFYSSNTQYSLYMSSTGSSWDIVSGENINVTPWTGSWKHFAFTRSGNTIRVFLDGTQTYTKTISGSLVSLTAGTDDIVGVGSAINGTSGVHGAMYIENFQIHKNLAKYTSNFTPPTKTQGRTYQAES